MGFEETGEGCFEITGTFSSRAGWEVEFEVGIAGRDLLEGSGGTGSEWRASEISVNEHAGGVDYGLKAGVGEFAEAFLGGCFDFFAAEFFVGEEELAVAVDFSTHEEINEGAGKQDVRGEGGGEFFDRWKGGKFAHRIGGRSLAHFHFESTQRMPSFSNVIFRCL